jgi:hypothetical protein
MELYVNRPERKMRQNLHFIKKMDRGAFTSPKRDLRLFIECLSHFSFRSV